MKYTIDRFEEGFAVLEDDKMDSITVRRSLVDANAKEGNHLEYIDGSYILTKGDDSRIRNKFNKLKKKDNGVI